MKATKPVNSTNELDQPGIAPPRVIPEPKSKCATIYTIWGKRLMHEQADFRNAEQCVLYSYEVSIPDASTVAEALESALNLTDQDHSPYELEVCSTTAGDLPLVDGEHYLATNHGFFELAETEILALLAPDHACPLVFKKWGVTYGEHRTDETPLVWHPYYWECECARDYLHLREQRESLPAMRCVPRRNPLRVSEREGGSLRSGKRRRGFSGVFPGLRTARAGQPATEMMCSAGLMITMTTGCCIPCRFCRTITGPGWRGAFIPKPARRCWPIGITRQRRTSVFL